MKKKPNGYWNIDRCEKSASMFSSKSAWKRGQSGAWGAATKNGWLQDIADGLGWGGRWTKARVKEDAAKYENRSEWGLNSASAYATARTKGWVGECCAHMTRLRMNKTPSDCVYIWRAIGEEFNGKPVYKIGVTNSGTGDLRIRDSARSMGFDYKIVLLACVGTEARYLEAIAHTLGDWPNYAMGDGRTEFRALSRGELSECVDLIKAAGVAEATKNYRTGEIIVVEAGFPCPSPTVEL